MKRFTTLALLCMICLLVTASGFAQNVNVNPGAGSYPDLTSAFSAINAGTHTGAMTVDIVGSTAEPAAGAILNASGVGSASYTSILIQPSGGAARTISGTATSGLPLIDLNGADNVTFDGLNTGGNSLTIQNLNALSTSGTSTIRFIGGATNNTITNCTILGSASMSVATNGATIFFSTDGVTANGNDNNTISNNDIGDASSGFPTKAILGNGSTTTTAIGNSGITITNNNIFNFFGAAVTSAGVAINGGCNTWTISNNRFYQTGTRTWTTGALNRAIELNSSTSTSGVQGMTVTGNIIGYASNTQTGTYTLTGSTGKVVGIYFNGISGGTVSSINNNTIASISITGVTSSGTGTTGAPLAGIIIANGLANTNSNTIGSQSATGSLTLSTNTTSSTDVYGFYNFSLEDWTATGNNIGGISVTNAGASGTFVIYGMRANTSTSKAFNASSNNVGGTAANSIQLNATGVSSQVIGIHTSNAQGVFTSNTVRNLTSNIGTGTSTSASVIGINITTTTPNHTVSQNTIFNLSNSNATAASTVTGLQFTGGTANVVERNLIYGLTTATNSTSAEVNGIKVSGGTTTYRNNMIAIGAGIANAIGTGSTGGVSGVNGFLGTDNFYHNSVFIDGAPTAGVGPSFAFNSTQTTNTRSFRDNIFFNGRSNNGATGKHYAVRVGGSTPNPTGLTINNNVYFANGTGAVFGFFNNLDVANLAAWKTAVGQDAGSFESNPQYNDPTNAVPDLHLHPTNPTVAEGNGADVGVTNDFDGQTRASLTPVDVGADAGNFVGNDLTPPAISYTALTNTSSTSARTLTATITDASGVPTSGAGLPVLYWRINAAGYSAATASSLGGGSYQFSFGSGVALNDTVRYYVVAQDGAPTPNVGSSPSAGASGFTANPPAATTPPTLPNSYVIVQPPLSGDYTVGLLAFNRAMGTNIQPEMRKRIVMRAFEIEVSPATKTADRVTRIEEREGEEQYAVFTQNRREYTGPLASPNGVYATITAAVNDVALRGVSGAVRFLLNDASYSDSVVIPPIAGASALNTITIRPNTGVTATISRSSATAIFTLTGADYIVIDGSNSGGTDRSLTVTNTSTSTLSAVIWGATGAGSDGATNNVIKNVNIAGSGGTQTLIGVGFGGSSIGTSSLGTGNNNNTIQNNNISNVQYGIYTQGASAVSKNTGNVITQNLINTASPNNVSKGGVQVGFENNIQVTKNSIDGVTQASSPDVFGIALGLTSISTSSFTGNEVTNATVTGNFIGKVTNTGTFSAVGISVASATSGTNLIANNSIYGVGANGTGGDFGAGIFLGGGVGSTTQIYFNSVSMTGTLTGGSYPNYCLAIGGTDPTVDARDNVLYNTLVNGTGVSFAIGTASTTFANLTSNYNDLYVTPGGGLLKVGKTGSLAQGSGTEQTLLSDWTTATGKDTPNSIGADPLFTSSTNLQPQYGSPVLNTGTTIGGITADILGVVRGTPPSIGAYEQGTGDIVPPTITYTQLTSTGSTGNRTLTATITDATGVQTGGGNGPRLYYKKSTQGTWQVDSAPSIVVNDFTFTLSAAALGGVTGGDIIQYYVAAQDIATVPNGGTNPAGGSGINPPGTTAPPSPNSYSILFVVSSFPYNETFEDGPSSPNVAGLGWSSGALSGTNDWVIGTPAKTQIAGAHGGVKAFVTKTTGTYSLSSMMYVQSPIFDFSALSVSPVISFWHNFKTEVGYDAGILEYSTDGGAVWRRADSTLGTGGTFNTTNSTGWYNSSSTSGSILPPKWSGTSTAYTGHSSGWIQSSTSLGGFNGLSDVRFRWRFYSDVSGVDEGWAIDDVRVEVPSNMTYASSTTTQNTANTVAGATNQQVIGIQVVMTNSLNPLNITSFTVNTNGTTSTGDLDNLKIYYTGTSSTFAPTGQFGLTVANPSGSVVVNGTQTLAAGTNYFWVAYDINAAALTGNVVDAECNSITGSGAMGTVVPTVQAPAGSRSILGALASGDYTVGTTLFNRIAGRNLVWEKRSRPVTVEVPIEEASSAGARSSSSPTRLESAVAGTKMQKKEVMEEYYVLTENGKPYTGPTFARVTLPPAAKTTQTSAAAADGETISGPISGDSPLGVYATITAAVADLNLRGVSGAVRFLLNDATYPSETYPIVINVPSNAPNATNTVTFKPNTGVTAVVSGSYAGPLWQIVNTNYVTIDGSNTVGGTTRDLTIENTSSTSNVLLMKSTSTTPISNTTIKNCVLRNGTNTYTAVIVGNLVGTTIDTTYFANTTLMNNSIQKAYIGLYVNGGNTNQNGTNLVLDGNALDSAGVNSIGFIGLYMQGVNGATIQKNNIAGFNGTNSQDDKGIWLASGTTNAVVRANKIHDLNYTGVSGYGVHGIYVSSTRTSANITVVNNMIYNLSGDGYDYTGTFYADNPIGILLIGTQTGVNVHFNSIYLYGNTLNSANALSAGIFLGAGSVADIRDNIIVNNLGLSGSLGYGSCAVYAKTDNTQFAAINYNDYFVNPTGSGGKYIGQIATTGSTTLAAWQTASAQDANSKNVAVTFVSATDLHLAAPSLSDPNLLGTPIAGITTDFDGDARDAVSPYMGADEGLAILLANVKVILQGPYNTGTLQMDNVLRTAGYLTGRFGPNVKSTAVDSITLEIRNAPTAAGSTIRLFQPAWLLQDGTIVSFNDSTKAYTAYSGAPAGNYYIVVWHRNHLAIMSATAQALTGSAPPAYDFTTGQSQAFGVNPMIQVNAAPVVFAMVAGDGDGSGVVATADANAVNGLLSTPGYLNSDINLSGLVTSADANVVFGNLTRATQVSRPVQNPDGSGVELGKVTRKLPAVINKENE